MTFDVPGDDHRGVRGRAREPRRPRSPRSPSTLPDRRACRSLRFRSSATRWSAARTCRSPPGCSPGRASLVLIVSFFGLSLAWHTSRFEDTHWRPVPRWISVARRSTRSPRCSRGRSASFLLGVTIWSGLNGHRGAGPELLGHLRLRHRLARVRPRSASLFGDVFRAFNPWRAIARVVGRRVQAGRRPVGAAAARLPRAARPLAGGGRVGRVRLARARLRPGRLSDRRPDPAHGRGRDPRLHGLHVRRHGPVRRREVAASGASPSPSTSACSRPWRRSRSAIGVLGIRRVLSASTKWVAEAPGSVALVLTSIGVTTFDGAGEGTLASPISTVEGWLGDIGFGPLAALRVSNSIFLALCLAFVVRPLLGRDLRHAHGPHQVQHRRAGAPVRPRVHPDRASPTWSRTTSASWSSRSRRSSRSCSPTRSATAPTCSGPRAAGSTTRRSAPTRSGTSRSAR